MWKYNLLLSEVNSTTAFHKLISNVINAIFIQGLLYEAQKKNKIVTCILTLIITSKQLKGCLQLYLFLFS